MGRASHSGWETAFHSRHRNGRPPLPQLGAICCQLQACRRASESVTIERSEGARQRRPDSTGSTRTCRATIENGCPLIDTAFRGSTLKGPWASSPLETTTSPPHAITDLVRRRLPETYDISCEDRLRTGLSVRGATGRCCPHGPVVGPPGEVTIRCAPRFVVDGRSPSTGEIVAGNGGKSRLSR